MVVAVARIRKKIRRCVLRIRNDEIFRELAAETQHRTADTRRDIRKQRVVRGRRALRVIQCVQGASDVSEPAIREGRQRGT